MALTPRLPKPFRSKLWLVRLEIEGYSDAEHRTAVNVRKPPTQNPAVPASLRMVVIVLNRSVPKLQVLWRACTANSMRKHGYH